MIAHWTRRLGQLYVGLVLYALADALMIIAALGANPWTVLHQGLAERLGLTVGVVTVAVSVVVLVAWIPLRQRPGVGTVSNAIVIGVGIDVWLAVLPTPHAWELRAAAMVAGVLLNGVATAAYIGARLGPGPRDGLMTGLVARTGRSVRLVRTTIEVAVLAAGWLLGGTVGVGTVLYALTIGPVVHQLLPRFTVPGRPARAPAETAAETAA